MLANPSPNPPAVQSFIRATTQAGCEAVLVSCWDRHYRNKVYVGLGVGGFCLGVFLWVGGSIFWQSGQLPSSLSPHPHRIWS